MYAAPTYNRAYIGRGRSGTARHRLVVNHDGDVTGTREYHSVVGTGHVPSVVAWWNRGCVIHGDVIIGQRMPQGTRLRRAEGRSPGGPHVCGPYI